MPDADEQPALLAAAVRLARIGGRIAADRIGQAQTGRKADRSFITQVDFEIQETLLRAVADEFSHHAVLAEEELSCPERHAPIHQATHCWVIDPLDGTRNFSRALPIFATSVAVLRAGRPIAAAVCHAMTGQIFAASAGNGATLDGRPVRVRDDPPTADTIVFVRGKSGAPATPVIHRWVDRFALRNIGSAALHLAFAAAGSADAAYHQQCKLWDLAAGWLLVTEAGGVITTADGQPVFPCAVADYRGEDMGFLAAGPELHAHMLADARAG